MDYGPRIRAARGWADLTQDELAARLGRDRQFILRRELPASDDRWTQATKGDLIAIAAVCGVPESFLLEGFGGSAPAEVGERLDQLGQAIDELAALAAGVQADVRELHTELRPPGEEPRHRRSS